MKAARFWEFEVKSPPLIRGKQDGDTVAVTVVVVVVVDTDTDVIVFVAPTEAQAELDVTVVVTVEAETEIVTVAVQLGWVLAVLAVEGNMHEQAELSLAVDALQFARKCGIPVAAV